ncbi:isomerase YbhE [Favolaschia claudopus]|uniref:Isomerase YbhE n=1 Tax=Favolaschia claudopus TaxID=2862362 RepID=A0AAV9ZL72_9AGAR
MVKFSIYTGGYTAFIVSYLFDTKTSSLTYVDTIPTTSNPSWLSPHLTNPNIFYAVNEVDYGSGDGEIVPTVKGGTKFDNSTSLLLTFPPPAGGVSHPHMAVEHGKEILVPDLVRCRQSLAYRQLVLPGEFGIHGFIQQPLGSGPRHMRVLNNFMYVLHETANLLTKQAYPILPQRHLPIPRLGQHRPHRRSFQLHLRCSGTTPLSALAVVPASYLYASNRQIAGTLDPRGDSIAIYDTDLNLVKQVFTGLGQIRGMEFGLGPVGEEYLVALGARTAGGADLVEVARNSSAIARTSLIMRPDGGY